MTDLTAFRMGLRRIDESGINRIMSHGRYGFIIISANRSEIYSDNPSLNLTQEYEEWCAKENRQVDDKTNMDFWLRKRNKIAEQSLLQNLKDSKFSYTPVYGGYHGSDDVVDSYEPSYIVYCHVRGDAKTYLNFQELYEFGLEMCKKYKQDSVYVQMPDKAPIYVNCDGQKTNSTESKSFKINDETQMFYTTSKRKKTNPKRFTADIQFESLYRKAAPSTYFNRMKRAKLGEVFIDK